MSEYKKNIVSEIIKVSVSVIIGGFVAYFSQQLLLDDIEYAKSSRVNYLSDQIENQGLAIAVHGVDVKSLSIVEFDFVNRTNKVHFDLDLYFTIGKNPANSNLLSVSTSPPEGLPRDKFVESITTKSPLEKQLNIKFIPKTQNKSHFSVYFLFDSETPPNIGVVSLSKTTNITEYQAWRDQSLAIAILLLFFVAYFVVVYLVAGLVEFFWGPKRHQKAVSKFRDFAIAEIEGLEKIDATERNQYIEFSTSTYEKLVRPKNNKFWNRVFRKRAKT